MRNKPETLNDLDPEPCCHGINKRELIALAVKWYKYNTSCLTPEEFIKYFFNLTEEDLE